MKFGIGVEGVDDTINTLDKLNKALKQQESAMKANLSTFDKADNSYEKLAQTEKDLTTVTELQGKKVDLLTKKREEAIQKYGAESKQVQSLTAQLNNASAKYNGLQRDLDKTQASMIKASAGVDKLTKEIKDNATEFQQTANAMDKAGDKAGAYEVRQEGLKKQANLTAQAISAQETAITQLAQKFGKNSTQVQQAEKELAAFKRQANNTNTELQGLENGLKQVDQGAKNSEGGFKASSAALAGLVGGVAASISTKALDMIAEGAGKIKEAFDEGIDATNKFQARLGTMSGQTEEYVNLASSLVSEGLAESLDEATDAMTRYQTTSTKALDPKDLKEMTANALAYSKAFDADLNESIRGVTRMTENFGISQSEAWNLMAAGARQGLEQTDELGDNMAEYSQLWAQMGYSASETFDILKAGLDGGAYNLDKVNDLVKEMGISLTDGRFEDNIDMFTGATQELFYAWKNGNASQKDVVNAMMKDMAGMGNNYEMLNRAGTVWSALGEDNSYKVIKAMSEAGGTFDDLRNNSEELRDDMGNTTAIQAFGGALKKLGADLGASVYKHFQLSESIENFAEVASPKLVSAVDTILTKLSPFVNQFFGGVSKGASQASKIIGIFGDYIGKTLYPMIKPILESLYEGFKDIFGFISDWWDTNGARVMKAIQNLLTILTPLFKVAAMVAQSFVDSVIGFIKGMVKVITGIIDVFSAVLTGDFTNMWTSIKNIFFGAIQAIWNWINIAFVGRIVKGIGTLGTSAKGIIKGMWDAIKGFFTGGINSANGLFTGFFNKIVSIGRNLRTNLSNIISSMWQSVKNFFTNGINNTNSLFTGFFNKIRNIANNLKSTVSNVVRSLWDGIKKTFRGGIDTVANWFSQLPTRMKNAINDGAGAIKKAFKGVFNGVLKAIEKPINGIIGGANWVLEKLGAPKLKKWDVPQYANGTPKGGHPVNGAMMVNDGRGAEMVVRPNGEAFIPKGKNVTMYGEKGTQVIKAEDTAALLGHKRPKFQYKNGTGFLDGLSNMWSGVKETASSIGSKMKSVIGDVMDYIDDPMKLAKKVITNAVDFGGMGQYSMAIGKGLMNKAIDALKDKITELFEANSSLDLSTGTAGVYKYLADVAAQVMKKFSGMRVTSGYRAGDPYSHGSRNAIDIAFPASMNGSQANVDAANYAFDKFPNKVGYVITNGRVRDRAGTSGTGIHDGWAPWTDGDHYDHVHINGVKNPQQFGGAISSGKGAGGDWETQIKRAAKLMGQNVTQAQVNGILAQIQRESGGNERIIQSSAVWDINTASGNPAQGLLQYIPQTFNAYKVRGYENILNGFHQLMAFFNNSNWRNDIQYGRSGWGPRGHRIKPYYNGGIATHPQLATLAENGYPEVIIPTEPAKRGRAMALLNTAKQMLGVKDNAQLSERKSASDDFATMILLMQKQNELLMALLAKDPNINLNGVKLNDGLNAIRATNERNSQRDLGLI